MSQDITVEALLKQEKDEHRKNICAYRTVKCLMKHEDRIDGSGQANSQTLCFFYHSPSEVRRGPFLEGKIRYTDEICEQIMDSGECSEGNECTYCHSDLELEYHPTQYKSKMCDRGSHPLQDYCPHAHTEGELRDVSGYIAIMDKPVKVMRNHEFFEDADSGNMTPTDVVTELPRNLQSKNSCKGIKKSVSMNYSGPDGMDVDIQSPKKKNNKKRKRQNKGKTQQDGKSIEAICFLDLKTFKVKQCTAGSNHNPKKCLNYHDYKRDRRRAIGSYSSETCIHTSKSGECQFGDSCVRSHNRVEEFYHPEKYKVKFCSTYPNDTESCEYGQFCSFAHHTDEITIDMIDDMDRDDDFYMFHFKTVWCPYTEKKHARDECVYAHNWQDFRRKPQKFPYSQEQCPQWHSRTFIQVYGDGCQNEFLCPFSHGWKEQEYHPKNYKLNA